MKEDVAAKLTGLTDQIIQSAVWQVKYWLPFELGTELAFLFGTVILWGWLWRKRKHLFADDGLLAGDLIGPLICIVALIMGLGSLLILLVGLPNTISGFFNPTFWAVKELLHR